VSTLAVVVALSLFLTCVDAAVDTVYHTRGTSVILNVSDPD
jgi:hypothetical protein